MFGMNEHPSPKKYSLSSQDMQGGKIAKPRVSCNSLIQMKLLLLLIKRPCHIGVFTGI